MKEQTAIGAGVDMSENLSTYYTGLCQEINPRVLSRMNEKYTGEGDKIKAVAKVALDYIFRNREGMLYTETDPKKQTVLFRWPYKVNTKFHGDGGWIEIKSENKEKSSVPKLTHAEIHVGKGKSYAKTESFKQGLDIDPESYLMTIETYVNIDNDRFYKLGTSHERSLYEVKPKVINENGLPRLVAEVRELKKHFVYEDTWPVPYISKTSDDGIECPGEDLIRDVIEHKQKALSKIGELSKEFPEIAGMTKKMKEASYNLKLGDVDAYEVEREGNKLFEENSNIRDEGEIVDIASGISSSDIIR